MVGPCLCLYSPWQTPTHTPRSSYPATSSGRLPWLLSPLLGLWSPYLCPYLPKQELRFPAFSVLQHLLMWLIKRLIKGSSLRIRASVSSFEKNHYKVQPTTKGCWEAQCVRSGRHLAQCQTSTKGPICLNCWLLLTIPSPGLSFPIYKLKGELVGLAHCCMLEPLGESLWQSFFSWYWYLNSGPSPWVTPPALFHDRFFRDGVLWTICLGWLWTKILLICLLSS
jgi:hypothetical protein